MWIDLFLFLLGLLFAVFNETNKQELWESQICNPKFGAWVRVITQQGIPVVSLSRELYPVGYGSDWFQETD